MVLVGVVVRVHGLRGEVVVDLHTDSPDERFAVGARLDAHRDATAPTTLTVEAARPHSGRLLVRFVEAPDRTAAEALRGTRLLVDARALPAPDDPDEFHVHQLEDLRAELSDGTVVGTVREVVHGPGGELLVVARPDLPDALVPFVRAIVPTVDVGGGRVVLTPPDGLLDAE
ncbi:MAG: ribosome maturation factor RimM [Pseudonocardia sp.]